MSALSIRLLDGRSESRLDGVQGLVCADASGQFGIRPGHEPLVTMLEPGLLRCRMAGGESRFLACAGGPLVCRGNVICIVSTRFLLQDDPQALAAQLARQLASEGQARSASRQSRAEMEQALMKRLREWAEARAS